MPFGDVQFLPASVTSVKNSDGTLTISPTTGDVVASLNLNHANVWTALQTFQPSTSVTAIALLAEQTTPATAMMNVIYTSTDGAGLVAGTYPFMQVTAGADLYIGVQAGNSNVGTATQFNHNTGIGYQALYSNTTANYMTAVGYQTLYSNTTGNATAVGGQALYSNTTGISNTGVGVQSAYSNTTGSYNSALGDISLYNNTTGGSNSAFAFQALYNNTTGSHNSGFGINSLYSNTTGGSNSAFGDDALFSFNDATAADDYIVAIGYKAGFNYTGAERNNTVIGASVLGTVGESNVLRIGNPSGTLLYGSMVAPFYLSVLGGFGSSGVTSVSANYTSTLADFLLIVSAAVTVTLPAASAQKGHLLLLRNTSAGTVTIAPAGADTSETTSLTTGQSALLVADGTSKWYDVGKSIV